LKGFQEYLKVDFEEIQGISMDNFLRVFRDIQGWFLKDFKEYPRIVS
jgi:hypothetical protein